MKFWGETSGVTVVIIDNAKLDSETWDHAETDAVNQMQSRGKTNVHLAANTDEDQKEKQAFLERRGYQKAFSMVDMACELSNRLTAASKLNEIDEKIAEKLFQLNQEAYAGREFIAQADKKDLQQFIADITSKDSICAVNYAPDEPVAFVWGLLKGSNFRIEEVSVRQNFRRRGIARSLLASTLAEAVKRGATTATLETNGENASGARELYESLGFKVTKTRLRYRKQI